MEKGRLPPVVSSLFSIKAAHLKRWYQRHGAGSKGQGADGATARYPRKRLRLTRGGIEHEHEHEEGNEEEKGTSNANTERRSNLRVIGYLLSVQASRLRPRLRTRQARLPLQAPSIIDRQNSNKKGN
jgi:hypothetical protein